MEGKCDLCGRESRFLEWAGSIKICPKCYVPYEIPPKQLIDFYIN